MSITDKQISRMAELFKLPDSSLNQLVEKLKEGMSNGEIFLENRKVGFALHVSDETIGQTKIDGVQKEKIGDLFYSLAGLTEMLIHSDVDDDKFSAKKLGIPDTSDDKINFLWKKLKDSGVLAEIDYQIHTLGDRVIGATATTTTKLVKTLGGLHPCADVLFEINSIDETKNLKFEIDKIDLKLLIKELHDLEKDIENISLQIKTGEKHE